MRQSNKIIPFILIFLLLLVTTSRIGPAEGATDIDTLVTYNYGDADQLDPAFAYNGGIIQIMHVYETLVSFNKEKHSHPETYLLTIQT